MLRGQDIIFEGAQENVRLFIYFFVFYLPEEAILLGHKECLLVVILRTEAEGFSNYFFEEEFFI